MFLVTITDLPVRCLSKDLHADQSQLASGRLLTVVTDNFLSTADIASSTLSVIETPFLNSEDPRQVVFSEVTINKTEGSVQIYKSTISGTPIYYHISSNGEFFCSTHISMLRKAGVPIEENIDALPEFFVYRCVMAPRTLFKDIKKVVAGSRVRLKPRNGRYEVTEVHDYVPPFPDTSKAIDIYTAGSGVLSILKDTIRPLKAVKNRIAIPLSGGLDSSVLFKLCQNSLQIDSSFSTGWPLPNGSLNTEKEYASSAADSFGTRHSHFEVSVEDFLYGFIEAIGAAEEPVHHLQSVLLYLLFKEGLPKSKDIVISGEGADGVFGSASNYTIFRSDGGMRRIILSSPISQLVEVAGWLSPRAKHISEILRKLNRKKLQLSDPYHILWSLGKYGSPEWVTRHFGVKRHDIISSRYAVIRAFQDRSLYDLVSVTGVLAEACPTKALWSKLAERQKKILYYPYHSTAVLDYIYRVPWEIKLRKPKNVLRQVAANLNIPEFIISRPKSALGIEPKHWAGPGGWFEPLVPLAAKIFPEKEIRGFQSTNSEKAQTFWNILNYSVWKRLIINNEPLHALTEEMKQNIGGLRCGID